MSTVSLKISRKRIRMHRPSFSRVMLYIFLCLMVVVCALPLFAMVCRALMPLDELYLYPPRLIVQKPTLRNFSDLLTSLSSSTVPFTRYIFNSLFTTVATVLASILVCCLGAYGLVKHRPAGSNIIFGIVVAALSFSTHVTTIPNYLVVNKLGLVNTCWALIIPKIAVAYNFFLVKQFCEQLPDSILEAARIDGANGRQTLFKVIIPNVMPSIATCTFLTLTNGFKLFDQNLALTGGMPSMLVEGGKINATELLALNIYSTYNIGKNYHGVAQAKAVIFFLLVAVLAIIQQKATSRKEVQQ